MAHLQTRAARGTAILNQENEAPLLQAGKQAIVTRASAKILTSAVLAKGTTATTTLAAVKSTNISISAAAPATKIPRRQPLGQKTADVQLNNGLKSTVGTNAKDVVSTDPVKDAKKAITATNRDKVTASATTKATTNNENDVNTTMATSGRRATRSESSLTKTINNKSNVIESTTTTTTEDITVVDKENRIPPTHGRKRTVDGTPKHHLATHEELPSDGVKEINLIVDQTTLPVVAAAADGEMTESTKRRKLEEQEALKAQWDEMEAEDLHDPSMCAEYAQEIMEYMMQTERTMMPDPNYIQQHRELDWRFRSMLVDWIIEVHHKFKMIPETLYLAVNVMDRFLSRRVCALAKLQLVGLTSLFIASKYEEVIAPPISQFVYMADNTYKDDEILRAERYILRVLDWSFNYPSPLNFLRRASKADNYDIRNRTVAKYLMELTLLDHEYLEYEPSRCAAAALYVARFFHTGEDTWDATYERFSGYSEDEVRHLGQLICNSLAVSRDDTFLYKKYANKRFGKASILMSEFVKEAAANDAQK